ncbi:Disulfide bond formation protein B [Candidatus Kinetoplastibacterium sorsogonicusi]|uniref:Disulfide bond formation protein B n=1 Tax=Candidatus Kinetoplastidibacterium kentomonadis TaxID=1576550 RepID=A0A3S7J9T1_9PROT|nr:Disulfide bond formation protein B [Candidatus Kinetoplastibacterium sorsogonicusi]
MGWFKRCCFCYVIKYFLDMKDNNSKFIKRLLVNTILSLFAVVISFIGQFFFENTLCSWCIFQRIIYILIFFISLLFYRLFFIKFLNNFLKNIYNLISILLILIWLIITYIQINSLNHNDICSTNIIEILINNFKLDSIAPNIFGIYTICSSENIYWFFMSILYFLILITINIKLIFLSKN